MRFRSEICVLLLLVMPTGCALFSPDAADRLNDQTREEQIREALKPSDVPVKRIVRLSSSVITQRVSENRVRNAVWQQMCETCLKRPQTRRRLNETGFRVGVSQPPYPWALDSLLSTSVDSGRQSGRNSRDNSPVFFSASGQSGTSIAVPEGSDSLVEVRRAYASEIPTDVVIPGLAGIKPEEQIRCMLRIRTLESGEDGALLQFQPELQFGSEAMRLTVRDGQEHLPVRQKFVPLFEQRFELKLHAGDVVVLGSNPQDEWTTGRFFFRSDAVRGSREHLVVLQIANIETVEGQPSVRVNYRKH